MWSISHVSRNTSYGSAAVHALDAAMRAAEVGAHGAHGTLQGAFAQALKHIRLARHTIQNGKPGSVPQHLTAVVEVLDAAATAATASESLPPTQETWSTCRGAMLINALGIRIGEVARLWLAEQGTLQAVLSLGGSYDVLGLFDIGGTIVTVPAHTLLFGTPQTIGAVLVSLPTFVSSADRIEHTTPVAARTPLY
jgi:hypothetical protein